MDSEQTKLNTQTEKKRCPMCVKRVNHVGIICKCGKQFCMDHTFPESHKCDFDYKSRDRKRLLDIVTK